MIKKIKSFLPYVKGSYGLVFISLLCASLATGSKLFIPFLAGKCVNLMKAAYDSNGGDFSSIGKSLQLYFIIMAALLVVGTIFRYIFDFITYLIGQRVIKNIRNRLFKATLESPISSIDQSRKGDLLLRLVNDVENVQTGLISGFAAFYDGIISIIITLVFMFTLNWILGLVVVGLTPISIFVSRFISKFNSKHFRKQRTSQGMVNAFASESLTNSEAVAALNIGEDRIKEFDKLSDEFRNSTFKANLGSSIINPSTRLVNSLINGALVLIGALLIINSPKGIGLDAFLVGDLSAFLTYASSYMQPFNEISNVVTEIDYALASFARIDETINGKKDINEGKEIINGSVDTLEAKDVTFSYDSKRKIIKNFSLDIYKGHKIAFVGPTGCGKTTLINLLMRFYDPQEGAFFANNTSTQDLEKSAFRKHIGMVLQDTWIFTGTVFENIAYAKEGATLDEVKEAARKAQASGFIERLPQGYDTIISDSSGLSVGEKQLICVARVMLLEPEIVVLDEATSNIDVRTEKLLSEAFDQLMKGKTSLVVAHRLSTIVSSDLIVVLKDGEIIEAGNHKELMAKEGFYFNLYNAQFN